MKSKIIIFLSIFLFLSCKSENKETIDGHLTSRYLFYEYFSPSEIIVTSEEKDAVKDSLGLYMELKGAEAEERITLRENPKKYKELALSFGEKGEKEFRFCCKGYNKSYGIKYIKLLAEDNNKKTIDVSENATIEYISLLDAIESNYNKIGEDIVKVKLSELGANARWITDKFSLYYKSNEDRRLFIEIGLESGEVLRKEFAVRG